MRSLSTVFGRFGPPSKASNSGWSWLSSHGLRHSNDLSQSPYTSIPTPTSSESIFAATSQESYERTPRAPNNCTWHPSRGISFRAVNTSVAPSDVRTFTTATHSHDCDLALHSSAEDAYVLAAWSTPPAETGQASSVSDQDHDSNLGFTISPEEYKKAREAADSPDGYWTHKLYSSDGDRRVKVHYCKSKEATDRVLDAYFKDKPILGFDIEWKPEATKSAGPKHNVSLIQLACEDRIALFHIAIFPGETKETLVSPKLREILEDANITKTGVAIKADCTRMKIHLGIECQGIFELSHLYKLVKHSSDGNTSMINKRLVALSAQVEEHLGLPLYKGDEVRGSDWSKDLDLDQITYAAADSYAGFMLYKVMESKRKQLVPTPPRPQHVEHNTPIRLASTAGASVATADNVLVEEDENESRNAVSQQTATPSSFGDNIINDPDVERRHTALMNAEEWTQLYRQLHPKQVYKSPSQRTAASPAQLRAYALWHHQNADVSEAATILGVKETTFTAYVMDAIRQEKLSFDVTRFRSLLADSPAAAKTGWKYRTLMAWAYTSKGNGMAWPQDDAEKEIATHDDQPVPKDV